MAAALSRADLAIGRLAGEGRRLPNPHLLIRPFVRREAVLSSRIEGTQATLGELLAAEAGAAVERSPADLREVANYVVALEHGVARLSDLPLSLRLVKELHENLMRNVRGNTATPGEFRRSQNWIGPAGCTLTDATHVPPPADRLMECLGAWERFLHDHSLPPLVHAALAHSQFEAIHPFLDGNGRVGRLMVTLLLCAEQVLREPMLYLSLFLKQQRARYYDLLESVRKDGDWEAWITFFCQGIATVAEGSVGTARRLLALAESDRERLERLGRKAGSAAAVQHVLLRTPVCTIPRLAKRTGLTLPTIAKALDVLLDRRIVSETTGKKRNRVYRYDRYLDILSEGTAPL